MKTIGHESRTAVRVAGFFSRGHTPVSWLIQKATDCLWSHCGIAFKMSDCSWIYYEALFGRKIEPAKPMQKLVDWGMKNDSNEFAIIPIPESRLLPGQAEMIRQTAETYVNSATYAELQLLAMWAFERWGWRVPASPGRVVCSEYLGRCLHPFFDVRPAGRSFDELSPRNLWDWFRRISQPTLTAQIVRFRELDNPLSVV